MCMGILEIEDTGVENKQHSVMEIPFTYLPDQTFPSSGQVTIWEHQPRRHPQGHSTLPSTEGATQLPLHSTDPSSRVAGASTQ